MLSILSPRGISVRGRQPSNAPEAMVVIFSIMGSFLSDTQFWNSRAPIYFTLSQPTIHRRKADWQPYMYSTRFADLSCKYGYWRYRFLLPDNRPDVREPSRFSPCRHSLRPYKLRPHPLLCMPDTSSRRTGYSDYSVF